MPQHATNTSVARADAEIWTRQVAPWSDPILIFLEKCPYSAYDLDQTWSKHTLDNICDGQSLNVPILESFPNPLT